LNVLQISNVNVPVELKTNKSASKSINHHHIKGEGDFCGPLVYVCMYELVHLHIIVYIVIISQTLISLHRIKGNRDIFGHKT
jgi:hypothetical protein